MNKILNRIAKLYVNMKYKTLMAMTALVSFVMEYAPVSYADTGDDVAAQVTGPLNNLVNVLTSVLAVVGVLMLVKSVTELVNAIQQQDNSGIFHAGRGIAAALLMIAIKPLIKMFGVGV